MVAKKRSGWNTYTSADSTVNSSVQLPDIKTRSQPSAGLKIQLIPHDGRSELILYSKALDWYSGRKAADDVLIFSQGHPDNPNGTTIVGYIKDKIQGIALEHDHAELHQSKQSCRALDVHAKLLCSSKVVGMRAPGFVNRTT